MWRAISQDPARDLGCELVQRKDAVSLSRRIYQTGHSPDDGGRLILNNDFSACFTNGLRPEHAVRSHTRHHHAQDAGVTNGGHRAK